MVPSKKRKVEGTPTKPELKNENEEYDVLAECYFVTTRSAVKENDSGYSWGILSLYHKETKHYQMFLDYPVERRNVSSLQTVSGSFLDEFDINGFAQLSRESCDSISYWMMD
jgi:hypothetical protein